MTRKRKLRVRGIQALVGSIVATLLVRWGAVSLFSISPEFPPLAGPGPAIFFTVILGLGALGVYGILRRMADRPDVVFRRIAVGVLLLSFLPDLWLLSDGAASAFPGATPTAIGVLMVMHCTAAAVIVWTLTARPADQGE